MNHRLTTTITGTPTGAGQEPGMRTMEPDGDVHGVPAHTICRLQCHPRPESQGHGRLPRRSYNLPQLEKDHNISTFYRISISR